MLRQELQEERRRAAVGNRSFATKRRDRAAQRDGIDGPRAEGEAENGRGGELSSGLLMMTGDQGRKGRGGERGKE